VRISLNYPGKCSNLGRRRFRIVKRSAAGDDVTTVSVAMSGWAAEDGWSGVME